MPSKCLFRRRSHAILKNAMMATVSNIVNEISCQEECSDYKEFNCRSFIYNQSSKQCYLSPDDKWNVEKTAKDDQNGSNYYEKVECLDGESNHAIIFNKEHN